MCTQVSSLAQSDGNRVLSIIGDAISTIGDELLVSAAKAGDRRAFAELYQRHSGMVRSIIYRITKNREDTEDALQDTALKAFLRLNTFEGRSTFASWIVRIATNSALILLRKRRTQSMISIEQLSEGYGNSRAWEPKDHSESAEAHCVRREREDLLRNAIRRLPCIYRKAVELQHAHECPAGRLAKELGISEAAAKARLQRSRGMLKQRLSRADL